MKIEIREGKSTSIWPTWCYTDAEFKEFGECKDPTIGLDYVNFNINVIK